MDNNETIVDFARVVAFLENNQLVQACAIVQRVENSLKEEISKSKTGADLHPLWSVFKAVLRTKTLVLGGNRNGSETEWKDGFRLLKMAIQPSPSGDK